MSRGTQVINGTEYIFEDKPYWDSKKKRGAHKRVYIGQNVNGEFVANKKFLLQEELNKVKKDIRSGPISTEKCIRKFYGAVYLLEQIGELTGVNHDLKLCFPDSYKQILSIVYYMVLESNPLYRFKKWNHIHKHTYGKDIPSQRSSELFTTIGETEKMKFFTKAGKTEVRDRVTCF